MLISRTLVKWGYNLRVNLYFTYFLKSSVARKNCPPANSNVFLSNEVGKSLCSGEEHGIRDVVDAGAYHG